MAAQSLAHVATPRPMRAFQVSLRSVSGCQAYAVMARSSSITAMTDRLDCYDGDLPVRASAKPITLEQFDYILARKLALAELVEGVEYV